MTAPGRGEIWHAYQKAIDEEVEAARGSRTNLDDRLSESLNPDGTPKAGSSIAKDWKASGDTPTYVDATSFTVPGDKTAIYVAGLRLQLDLGATTVYNTVLSSSVGAVTTITVETANLTADLQGVDYGIVSPGAAGSLPGHRHSGEGDGGLYDYAADAEASDTYKVSLSPAPSAYYTGMLVHFKANTANTGAATLNVNNLGNKTIKKYHDQDLETGDIESGQIVTVIYDGTNFQMLSQLEGGKILDSDQYGMVLSNDTDADHDINISAGACPDSTRSKLLESTEMTKQIDAAWAVGNDAGGMFLGSVAANTIYHYFIIEKDSDGSIDAGYDTSPIAANMPAGYTKYRWRGYVLTDASSNIIPFTQLGDGREVEIWMKARFQIATGLASTTYATQALSGVMPTASGHVLKYLPGGIGTTGDTTVWISDDGVNAKTISVFSNANNSIGLINELYYSGSASPIFVPISGNNTYYKVSGNTITLFARAILIQR